MEGRYGRAALALLTTAAVAAALALTGGGGYAASGLALSKSASAQQYQYPEERPGWGCGDDNHVHTGPPGRRQYGPSGPPTPPPGCTQYKGKDR
jgi:hypothetical protein